MEQHAPPQNVRRTLGRYRRHPRHRRSPAEEDPGAARSPCRRRAAGPQPRQAHHRPLARNRRGPRPRPSPAGLLRPAPGSPRPRPIPRIDPAPPQSRRDLERCGIVCRRVEEERSRQCGLVLRRTLSGRFLSEWRRGIRGLGGDRAGAAGEPMRGCVGGAGCRSHQPGRAPSGSGLVATLPRARPAELSRCARPDDGPRPCRRARRRAPLR